VNHLALAVSDQARSTRFYLDYFGFVPEPEPREDRVLILHDATGFSLALGEIDEPTVGSGASAGQLASWVAACRTCSARDAPVAPLPLPDPTASLGHASSAGSTR
jgi:catechol 2,3-dioxygenase-like lactoylglutathione lyase family enzyme